MFMVGEGHLSHSLSSQKFSWSSAIEDWLINFVCWDRVFGKTYFFNRESFKKILWMKNFPTNRGDHSFIHKIHSTKKK